MTCKVCGANSTACMSATLLGKYDVTYYQCVSCQFIQTEEPYWLAEAYSDAIASLDIGLIQRNEVGANIVQNVIYKWFDGGGKFVDYGGGYGMLVRMMRDRGYDFYRYDLHCENLFARTFEAVEPIAGNQPYTLLTAFEVFEHLVNPAEDLKQMLQYSPSILFSTVVQPNYSITPESWWYVLPETGQHIALYSTKSLQVLAEQHGLQVVSGHNNMHLMTRERVNPRLFKWLTDWRGTRLYSLLNKTRRSSLLDTDYAHLRSRALHENPF
jgi:hypothetical protein